ncbi:MAG: cytidylate kinase-like family protein [Saccharofermentans sp.]|nr:cytidylate kinase-like family protein [Saccharofermentans sp.]
MGNTDKQFIISVGREYGSGGIVIAEELAKRFNVPFYERSILENIAKEKGVPYEDLKRYDEAPKIRLFHRKVKDNSTAPQDNVAKMQFDYILDKAKSGESFVVVGRCAEEVLKEYKGKELISIFILADKEDKIKRISEVHHLNEEDAWDQIVRENARRKAYHNYYCKGKWGDSRNYDFSLNDSRLGMEGAIDAIETYVKRRLNEL